MSPIGSCLVGNHATSSWLYIYYYAPNPTWVSDIQDILYGRIPFFFIIVFLLGKNCSRIVLSINVTNRLFISVLKNHWQAYLNQNTVTDCVLCHYTNKIEYIKFWHCFFLYNRSQFCILYTIIIILNVNFAFHTWWTADVKENYLHLRINGVLISNDVFIYKAKKYL